MKQEWTKEPWTVENFRVTKHNLARTVLCVNACEWLPDEDLEGINFHMLMSTWKMIMAEQDKENDKLKEEIEQLKSELELVRR